MKHHLLTQRRHAEAFGHQVAADHRIDAVGRMTQVQAQLGGDAAATQPASYGASVFADAAAQVYARSGLPLQARGALDGPDVHAAAARGVAGSGGTLPFLDVIQRSFGRHDVGGVTAHVGGESAEAAGSIGATAYALGNDVAFASTPDLHLAAHEAAHVVQQRAGVHLAGGVGRAGDPYEQHADAVADLVVQGKSAEALLDRMPHGMSAGGAVVQRDEAAPHTARSQRPPTLRNLRAGSLARAIRAVAGDVGESRELELAASVMIPETPIVVGGRATIEVVHTRDGYKVAISPRLSCGLTTPDRSADANLFTDFALEVHGRTPEIAARLLAVGLDHALRESANRPPPAFLMCAAVMIHPLLGVLVAIDGGIRAATGRAPYWLWLADNLFGGGARQQQTRAHMAGHDYVETRDGAGAGVNLAAPGGARAAASLATERRWRLEGEAGAIERAYRTTTGRVAITAPPFSGVARFTTPARDRSIHAGGWTITLAAAGRLAGFGTSLLVNVMGQVFQALDAVTDPAERAALEPAGDSSSYMVNALQEILNTSGHPASAKLIVELAIPYNARMRATFKLASEVDAIAQGNGARIAAARQIGQPWIGPVIAAPRQNQRRSR